MSYSFHELLGMAYPVYYCRLCAKSFEHADSPAAHCPVCRRFTDFFEPEPQTCCHHGDRELVAS